MNSVLEIEQALRQLPPQEQLEIARWLLEDLQEAMANSVPNGSSNESQRPWQLPDYASRRRRIFGSKILPNMVLAARAEERW